ncbi:hypothetical protein WJX77_002809 [Trebouxia sp. C0004]
MLLSCGFVPTRPDVSGAHFAVACQSSPRIPPFAGHLWQQHAGAVKHQRYRCTSRAFGRRGPSVPPKPASVEPKAASPVQPHQPTPTQPAAKTSAQDPPQADVLLELRNVYKSFGSKPILRGANMTIRRGEAVGIIGGSGTGKSTTLRIMAGLLMPDVGQVLIKGKARKGLLADDKELASQLKVGMVFQNGALFDSLNVQENVGFMLYEHSNLPADRIEELVAQALKAVGLSGVESLFPGELSGGMKKRVALARAIIRDSENDKAEQVVMYDEPTAGLDPVASTVVEDLIRSLQSQRGMGNSSEGISSYIVVTHQHSTIRRAVDRLIFLHEGRVVWEGPTAEFDKSEEAIVQQFSQGSLEGPIKYL